MSLPLFVPFCENGPYIYIYIYIVRELYHGRSLYGEQGARHVSFDSDLHPIFQT